VAVDAAGDLVDANNKIAAKEVGTGGPCVSGKNIENLAKCRAIVGFGRALHGGEDFYAHSNWTDVAYPPYSALNPPGLGLSGPARPLLLLSTPEASPVAATPPDFTTECYNVIDRPQGFGACSGRATHATMTKDEGKIDAHGHATDPTNARGCGPMSDHSAQDKCGLPTSTNGNFVAAVAGAQAEVAKQWQDFRAELQARYGQRRADLIACVITSDNPLTACPNPHFLYRAVIHHTFTCSGQCEGPSPTAIITETLKTAYTLTGDVELTRHLPIDANSLHNSGVGQIGPSKRPGEAPSGSYTVDSTNPSAAPGCTTSHTEWQLDSVSNGVLVVSAVDAVGPEHGPPTDFHVDVVPKPWHMAEVTDAWTETTAACGQTTTTHTEGPWQVTVVPVSEAHVAHGEDLPGVLGLGFEVKGWTLTPKAPDRVIARKHETFTVTKVPGTSGVASETRSVTEDFQLVTDDSCATPNVWA
jgi:hypothetical protein